jgi:hypothetical protein
MVNNISKMTPDVDISPELLDGICQLDISDNTDKAISIFDLPPGILNEIALLLPCRCDIEFHQVCRYLYTSTWSAFMDKALRELETDLSVKSLYRLEEVA